MQFMADGVLCTPEFKALASGNSHFVMCPMLDARRMEVYRQLISSDDRSLSPIVAEIIDSGSFNDILQQNKVLFFGSGADKCSETIINPNAVFAKNIRPHAIQMLSLANEYFEKTQFEDLAYFEPFYLKDFVATTSKKQLLTF
jgi:tRNA threonylcarbamoyladenosine biosynthesis protein TsaB